MKICIAQSESFKGEIEKNIENHLRLIDRAIRLNSDLIIFPELSTTGYEPNLAKSLATDINDSIFTQFQILADQNNITIGIGMPTNSSQGIKISMLIFQPNKSRESYSKQELHSDELPYFVSGNFSSIITLADKKIAFGICFETLKNEPFEFAKSNGADIYIASVAKSKVGIKKANNHYSKMASKFQMNVLMSNCVGFCDNFLSEGQSAVWNKSGIKLNQLDSENQGILVYDTELESTEIEQLKIERGTGTDLDEVFQMYLDAKHELDKNGIHQWTDKYPRKSIIESDLNKGVLYILKKQNEIVGAINISEEQEAEYLAVNWKTNDLKPLVIHRLVVQPNHQKKGYAQFMMNFAEEFARENHYKSIRLDAYSQNKKVIEFYKNRNYFVRGEINFPGREYHFFCFEKEIIKPLNYES